MKKSTKVVLSAVSALLISAPAFAFHDGGVAQCEGCHTMHNSANGAVMTSFLPQYMSGPFLLKAEDQSGSCLNCHQGATDTGPKSYHVSTIDTAVALPAANALNVSDYPKQRGPGGDFRWLKAGGDNKGHNIVAKNFNYAKDSRLNTAPGGAYPAANLACSSCHDPHGKYRYLNDGTIATTGAPIVGSASYTNAAPPAGEALGVFRILGGKGYLPKSLTGTGVEFAKDEVPVAVTPSSYNASEASTPIIVAYGKNMSEWCANCHGSIHANQMAPAAYLSGTAQLTHPAGNAAKLSFIADNYNAYVTSGVMTGGTYSTLVPFEQGKAFGDATLLAGTAPTASGTDSNVSCLSCHRVHASGFDSMLRFDVNMMTVDDAGTIKYSTSPSTNAYKTAAYYDRAPAQFGVDARTLCNKCHAKD